jgi:hypothetical protein
MIVVRAQRAPLAEAVGTTFDGEHPCAMCHATGEGNKEEMRREQSYPASEKRNDLRLIASVPVELPEVQYSGESRWPEFHLRGLRHAEAPPVPPPLAQQGERHCRRSRAFARRSGSLRADVLPAI